MNNIILADKTRKMVEENKMSVADVSARPRPTFQKAPVVEEMNEMPLVIFLPINKIKYFALLTISLFF